MIINKPPMGWNTWNTFESNINEQLILESADKMVECGLRDAGYEYVVIDDMWSLKERDENGRLVPDPEKFPHGMKYVADYIHSKGLKFGMYSCAGYVTCAGYPGSYEHEWIDAQTFAEWGVDFLKYDFCFHDYNVSADVLYKRMGIALANCGRDILFSACSWGSEHTRVWVKETGAHMWRSTYDINDSWASIKLLGQSQLEYQEYNAQGCFNDMDMLVVGMNGEGFVGITGCNEEEYKLHFSLWALLNSPLMIGCDIRNMSDETKNILMNKDIIAINQDIGARQPFMVNNQVYKERQNKSPDDSFYENNPIVCPIVAKFLDNGDIAIGVFNFSEGNMSVECTLDSFGLPLISGKTLELKELWTGESETPSNRMLFLGKTFAPHSCKMYIAKVVDVK